MRLKNCEELRRSREMVRKAGFCGVNVCIKKGKCERLFVFGKSSFPQDKNCCSCSDYC